jgi:pimeloyl-ACP methyl ester carboxylesterase
MIPELSELDPRSRLLLHGSVATDLVLRTAVGAVVSAVVLPGVTRAERRRLEFYADLADAHDVGAVFARPPEVEVTATSRTAPDVPGVQVDVLRFESPFVALNPEVREDYASHVPNRTGYAQHWRHPDGPRPTLCVIHGFGASPAWFNSSFFSLRTFFDEGWDVLLYTLPFHGARRGTPGLTNGLELFAHGFAGFSEALIHAVHDFRVLLDYLERYGAPRVGVTGLSLGGYIAGMLGASDSRLDFVIPNAAISSIPAALPHWFPVNIAATLALRLNGSPTDLLDRALMVHSPLNYPPLIPKDRLMVVGGLGDRLAAPEQSLLLWEHWDRPRIHWFLGSHLLHFGRHGYFDDMLEVMRAADAAPDTPTTRLAVGA